jgi:hypothetical protein
MGKRKKCKVFAKFNKITRREPFDHIHNKRGYETEDQKRMG